MESVQVLIVDDEELACLSLADFLQEAGYAIMIANNGERAVELLQQQCCMVCIVDIRLPGMDGVETILALHTIAPTTRFIVYTGSPEFSVPPVLQPLRVAEQYVVRKPVEDMGIFITLIEQLQREVGALSHES